MYNDPVSLARDRCSLRWIIIIEKTMQHMTPRGNLGNGRRAGPSRGVPRICHASKFRKQDRLAKELTKGCAGRTRFSRYWRAQLLCKFPQVRPGIPGVPCSAHVAIGAG